MILFSFKKPADHFWFRRSLNVRNVIELCIKFILLISFRKLVLKMIVQVIVLKIKFPLFSFDVRIQEI